MWLFHLSLLGLLYHGVIILLILWTQKRFYSLSDPSFYWVLVMPGYSCMLIFEQQRLKNGNKIQDIAKTVVHITTIIPTTPSSDIIPMRSWIGLFCNEVLLSPRSYCLHIPLAAFYSIQFFAKKIPIFFSRIHQLSPIKKVYFHTLTNIYCSLYTSICFSHVVVLLALSPGAPTRLRASAFFSMPQPFPVPYDDVSDLRLCWRSLTTG